MFGVSNARNLAMLGGYRIPLKRASSLKHFSVSSCVVYRVERRKGEIIYF